MTTMIAATIVGTVIRAWMARRTRRQVVDGDFGDVDPDASWIDRCLSAGWGIDTAHPFASTNMLSSGNVNTVVRHTLTSLNVAYEEL
jgi:hypothetical protein